MQYLGSKRKLASQLLGYMLPEHQGAWIEPFVGGGNMICRVSGPRVGNDLHGPLIALLSAVASGWEPPSELSRETYYAIKANPGAHPPEIVGFAGFLCSFGGKWWGGYAHNKTGTNYALQGKRSLLKQAPSLSGVRFTNLDYRQLDIPKGSTVYCDPPYRNTTGYGIGLNHEEFYEWCRRVAGDGSRVFVSEYEAPKDFELLAEFTTTTVLDRNRSRGRSEKLYRVK